MPDQAFQRLGTEAHTNREGWLEIGLSSQRVTEGQYLAADAVLIATHDSCPRPGSWANREENGLISGMVIDVGDTQKRVDLEVYPGGWDLTDYQLKLEWDREYVKVWNQATGGSQIQESPEENWKTWTIGTDIIPESVFVSAENPGGTDVVLTLLDAQGQPLNERPWPDVLCLSINE